jgi:hypothetical protein
VEVRHATGLASFYAHMGAIAPGVAPGVALKAGTPVGWMGSTGTSTGPHLHLEIRDDQERPLNPQLFLGRAFAREGDLPMRNAARVPRGVRVAYVSQIPASKRAVMAAKAEAEAAAEASDELAGPRRLTPDARRALIKTLAAAEKAQPAPPVKLQIPPAPSAADAAINGRVTTGADGRPHITLNL